MSIMKARELVDQLALLPHPEGGWYREIHRSRERVQTRRGFRSALTTIPYLLEHKQLSRWHVVESIEIWHCRGGAARGRGGGGPAARRRARRGGGGSRE